MTIETVGPAAVATTSASKSPLESTDAGGQTRPASVTRFRRKAVGAEIGRMFEAHGTMAFALCKLLLRNTQDAEDATQQVFLSAYRGMLGGTVPEDAGPWLATIARNECLTRLRRRAPDTVALREADHPHTADMADLAGRRDAIAALCEAIAGLPPAQRQAVILRDFYGLSYREVSVALGLSGPAVESLLFKSRKRLQERLRPIQAANGIALPLAARDALVRAIPGFSGGLTATGVGGAGAGISAKILSAPVAAKIAALVLAAGLGTVTLGHEPAKPSSHRAARAHRATAGPTRFRR